MVEITIKQAFLRNYVSYRGMLFSGRVQVQLPKEKDWEKVLETHLEPCQVPMIEFFCEIIAKYPYHRSLTGFQTLPLGSESML